MKKLYSTCLVACLALAIMACQSEEIEEDFPATTSIDSSSVLPPVAPATQMDAVIAAPALNPAHGQPFHDCSIAVGAPLINRNANSSTQRLPPAQTLPAVPPLQPVLPSLRSGGKLNPPHGKPGHKCEIAVGAPLI
jgi:hypothetical protein